MRGTGALAAVWLVCACGGEGAVEPEISPAASADALSASAPYSLRAAPCRDIGPIPPRRWHACRTQVFDGKGKLEYELRFDRDGHLLQNIDGEGRVVEDNTYVDGHLVKRVQGVNIETWTFDRRWRLLRFDRSGDYSEVPQYDRSGRIDHVELSDGWDVGVRRYTYSELRVDTADVWDQEGSLVTTTDTFFPTGALRTHEERWSPIGPGAGSDYAEYDEVGHLIAHGAEGDWGGSDTRNTYEGDLLVKSTYESTTSTRETLFRYDASGHLRLQHETWDWHGMGTPNHGHATTRLTYACRSNLVVSIDFDENDDGVVDSRTEYTLEPARTTAISTRQGKSSGRVIDDYDCHSM